jgi:hypothetical protein
MQHNEQIYNPRNNDSPPELDLSTPADFTLTYLLKEAVNEQLQKDEKNENALPMSSPIGLQVVEEILAGPSNQPILASTPEGEELCEELQERVSRRSQQTSPANTEDIHPGYPYRENINNNNDLLQDHYPHPYLAAQVNRSDGDPRILGKEERGAPTYDEGLLVAQSMAVVRDDLEDEVATYPLGENVYLDTDFLQAMGELDDRGLAAEGLRLIQLDREFRYLEQWE